MGVELKQVVRQTIEEVFGRGNVDHLDTVCDPSYRSHDPASGGDLDLAGQKQMARMYKAAFPDLQPTIVRQWIDQDGDTVTSLWSMTGTHQGALQGIAPTGRRCTADGCLVSHFRGAKLVEEWVQWDALGLMRQLGVAPQPAPDATARAPEARPH